MSHKKTLWYVSSTIFFLHPHWAATITYNTTCIQWKKRKFLPWHVSCPPIIKLSSLFCPVYLLGQYVRHTAVVMENLICKSLKWPEYLTIASSEICYVKICGALKMGKSNSVICMYFVPIFNSLHCTVLSCNQYSPSLYCSLFFLIWW